MIAIRRCTKNDISMLARLNQMLIVRVFGKWI